MRAFQYKVLNNTLYTNDKLFKRGFISYKGCSFCKIESETLTHLLYSCPHSRVFLHDFPENWFLVRQERIHLTLEDIIVGGHFDKTMPLTELRSTDWKNLLVGL